MTAANRRHRDIRRSANGSLVDVTAVREWLAQMDARNAPRRVVRLSDTDPMFQTPARLSVETRLPSVVPLATPTLSSRPSATGTRAARGG